MKKIDKLIFKSFIGPFILTYMVCVFILLLQHLLQYFDDIVGKGLGWDVLGTLIFYFAIFMTPLALPLAVLLSSLITFGNLSEHFEITAIKSLGISLVRTIFPIFLFTILLTFVAFYINNDLVPKSALEAYSLLYDIKRKKPTMDLQEGAFYSGLGDFSIKVEKKFPDGITLKGVIIYDHRHENKGNSQVTMADSGRMYTMLNNRYLKLELFNGYDFHQGNVSEINESNSSSVPAETFRKTKFARSEILFDLSSFELQRTDKKSFQGNRIMRNISELGHDLDSINDEILSCRLSMYENEKNMFSFHLNSDSITLPRQLQEYKRKKDSLISLTDQSNIYRSESNLNTFSKSYKYTDKDIKDIEKTFDGPTTSASISGALDWVRNVKNQIGNLNIRLEGCIQSYLVYQAQWHKILANSFACIVMFLIGAPLGTIIKKGGLGVPVIVSIFFFILLYILSSMGEKWAMSDRITMPVGIWLANVILLVIGLIFLRQARRDARLFDIDFYLIAFDRLKTRLKKLINH